ncbi:MAG: immunoglobulin domain-containing protein [Bacteroidetes bacterium]|nr:immunoglobulin domain-containing protein [Bacteroidota bacterium]
MKNFFFFSALLCFLVSGISELFAQQTISTATVTGQPVTVTLSTQPQTQNKCLGSSVTFTVAANGTAPYSYQWIKDGFIVPGATSASYTIPSVSLSNQGMYSCQVSNLCRSVTSNQAELKVVSLTINAGTDATFCNDSAVQLNAVAATNYPSLSQPYTSVVWTPSTALSDANIINPVAQPLSTTTYMVTLTDALGCIATDEIILTSKTPVSITTQPLPYNKCLNSNVTFTVNTSGTAPITYIWKKNTTTISGADASTLIMNNLALSDEGTYLCEATNYCRTVVSNNAELKVIDISANAGADERICEGDNTTLTAIGGSNHATESGTLSFLWSPATGLDLTNAAVTTANPVVTTNYTVEITDVLGCTETDEVLVTVGNVFQDEQICLVTVDTVAWKNKVMWEKTADVGTETTYIYKEVAANVYNWIGSVPYDSASYFIDYSSVPESHGDKYKISVVDTCTAESDKSYYHKTMNLVISSFGSTMGLTWTPYEDESGNYTPPKYYIYRGTQPDNMSLLDSISSSFTSYNDNNVFEVYYYMVGVQKDPPCGIYSSRISYSNKKDNSTLIGLVEYNGFNNEALSIFPNPFKESTTVKFYNPDNNLFQLTLTDASGRMVRKVETVSGNEFTIDRKELGAGVYLMELSGESRSFRGKIVVE